MNEITNEAAEEVTEATEKAAEAMPAEANEPAEGEPSGETTSPEAEPQPARKKKRGRWLAGLIILLLALAAGAFAVLPDELPQRRNIELVIASAEEKLGLPYRLGALGPYDYDCSSLVQTCFADIGVELPRLAVDIGYSEGYQKIERIEDLLRGDIVCWDTVEDDDLSDHVGICLGGGRVLHASSKYGEVMISDLEGYYAEKFSWGLRPLAHIPLDIPLDLSFLAQSDLSFLESWDLSGIAQQAMAYVEDWDLSFIKEFKLPFGNEEAK